MQGAAEPVAGGGGCGDRFTPIALPAPPGMLQRVLPTCFFGCWGALGESRQGIFFPPATNVPRRHRPRYPPRTPAPPPPVRTMSSDYRGLTATLPLRPHSF